MSSWTCMSIYLMLKYYFNVDLLLKWQNLGRTVTRGAKGSGAPLNKNSDPLKCPACPPKLPYPLRQFQDSGFFWKPTEN